MNHAPSITLATLVESVAAHRLEHGAHARVAFVLHPGGAAGAFQAGALQAMAEAGLRPDLLVGTSIGAFNALGFWLDELTGRAPFAPAGATHLGKLWRRLSHRGQGSRLLLDKPWLLGWITGRPDWNHRMAGDLAHQLTHAGATWAALQHGIFSVNRLEFFTRRLVADALGLPRRASAEDVGAALTDAARSVKRPPPPDLIVVATDVMAHAPVAFVLGSPATGEALGASGWDAHVLGVGTLVGQAALEVFYASASIPGVFPPRVLKLPGVEPARPLVDGVIGNNRPFQLAVDAGASLIISFEVESGASGLHYACPTNAHFVAAAAEAFMTVGDHFVRESARELALVNRALGHSVETRASVVPLYRVAPERRRLGLLDFDGRYEDGRLATSLYDDFMYGYATAGGNASATWQDYVMGRALHGDTGSAESARRTGHFSDATLYPLEGVRGLPGHRVTRAVIGTRRPGLLDAAPSRSTL